MFNKCKGWNYSLPITAFPLFTTDGLRLQLYSPKASALNKTEAFSHQLGYCPTRQLIFTDCVYSVSIRWMTPTFPHSNYNLIYWHFKVKQQYRRKHLDCQKNSRCYTCTWCILCNTSQKVKIHGNNLFYGFSVTTTICWCSCLITFQLK